MVVPRKFNYDNDNFNLVKYIFLKAKVPSGLQSVSFIANLIISDT